MSVRHHIALGGVEEKASGVLHLHGIYYIPKVHTYTLNSKTYRLAHKYLEFFTNCYPLV